MASFLHDAHPRLEDAFVAMLDESLAPRDPSMMLATVRSFDLPPDSMAVDVGCGEGAHAFRLAAHFGLRVLGIDPVQRHLDLAREARRSEPEVVASRVSFERGTADRIPLRDASVDLVWCRDTLAHAPSLASAFREFARVLRPGGRALVHQVLATDLLAPEEADWLFPVLGRRAGLGRPGHDGGRDLALRPRRRRLGGPRVGVGRARGGDVGPCLAGAPARGAAPA